MKKNEFKSFVRKAALTPMLAAMLVACGPRSDKDSDTKAPAKTEVKSAKKELEKKATQFHEHVVDSVMAASGARQENSSRIQDECELDSLYYRHTLGGTMDHEAIESGMKIINKAFDEIMLTLSKYSDDLACITKQNLAERTPYVDQLSICLAAEYEWSSIKYAINETIEGSDFGDVHKDAMKTKVEQIIEKTIKNLSANKNRIAQKYSDYYIISEQDKELLGYSYCGDGEYESTFRDLNNAGKYIVSRRCVHVYDSKLSVDFFGEPGYEYKLVSLGNHKWQVVRTKGGKSEKTPVFTDNSEFSINQDYCSEKNYFTYTNAETGEEEKVIIPLPKVGETSFSFYPGQNMGVHIEFSEVLEIKQRKKDWETKIPGKDQQQIDSLKKEIQRKKQLEKIYDEATRKAWEIADSLTDARFGHKH